MNLYPSSDPLPPVSEADDSAERHARASAILAKLDALVSQSHLRPSPERESLNQARMEQQAALRFAHEASRKPEAALRSGEEVEQVGLLLGDALRTAAILLSLKGPYLQDQRWSKVQRLVESLSDSLYDTLEDRVRFASQVALEEAAALDSIRVLPEAA